MTIVPLRPGRGREDIVASAPFAMSILADRVLGLVEVRIGDKPLVWADVRIDRIELPAQEKTCGCEACNWSIRRWTCAGQRSAWPQRNEPYGVGGRSPCGTGRVGPHVASLAYNPALDGLRGVAIIAVVIYHLLTVPSPAGSSA